MKHCKELKDKMCKALEESAALFMKTPSSKTNYDIYILLKNIKMLKEHMDNEGLHENEERKGYWS